MLGHNLYYIPREYDQTGDEWDGEPVWLHLSYGSYLDAFQAKKVLETLYGEGRICIDTRSGINTYMPGENYP